MADKEELTEKIQCLECGKGFEVQSCKKPR